MYRLVTCTVYHGGVVLCLTDYIQSSVRRGQIPNLSMGGYSIPNISFSDMYRFVTYRSVICTVNDMFCFVTYRFVTPTVL